MWCVDSVGTSGCGCPLNLCLSPETAPEEQMVRATVILCVAAATLFCGHRYIHEVLQMYDGGDSSDSGAASDSSWDDPEHKNLFDRL